MARLTLGLGYNTLSEHMRGNKPQNASLREHVSLDSVALGPSIDLGASPVANLVIHARLAGLLTISPTVQVDGADQHSGSIVTYFLAPGVTYYFMPVNLYVTGALGISRTNLNDHLLAAGLGKIGLGLNLDVGKEWWFTTNMALGIAARFCYAHSTRAGDVFTATDDASGFLLAASVTSR